MGNVYLNVVTTGCQCQGAPQDPRELGLIESHLQTSCRLFVCPVSPSAQSLPVSSPAAGETQFRHRSLPEQTQLNAPCGLRQGDGLATHPCLAGTLLRCDGPQLWTC